MTQVYLDGELFGQNAGEVSNFVTGGDMVIGLGHYELLDNADRAPQERRFPERLSRRSKNDFANSKYDIAQIAVPKEGDDLPTQGFGSLFCLRIAQSITIDTATVANISETYGIHIRTFTLGTRLRFIPVETTGSIQKIRSDLYIDGYVTSIGTDNFNITFTGHSGSGTFTQFYVYHKGTPLDTTAATSYSIQQSILTAETAIDVDDNNFVYWPMLHKPKMRISITTDITVQPVSYANLQDGATFSLWVTNSSVGIGNSHALLFNDPHTTILWANGSPPPTYLPAGTVNLICFESFYSGSGVVKLLGTYVLNFR